MKINHMQSNSKSTATASMFRRALKRFAYISAAGALLLAATSSWAAGGNNAYHWTNLVSHIPGGALRVDSNLVNPWGLAAAAPHHLWVAGNGRGGVAHYSKGGGAGPPVGIIPPRGRHTEGGNLDG